MQTKTFLIPVVREFPLSTDGTANPVYYDITNASEKLRTALPYAVSLTLYSLTEGEPATNGPT